MGVLADAGEDIGDFTSGRRSILDAVGRDHWEPESFCQIAKLLIDALFTTKEMPLNFHEDLVASPDVDQLLCGLRARSFPEQSDKSGGKFRQFIPLHGAAPLFAPQMRLGEELAQIFATFLRLDQ